MRRIILCAGIVGLGLCSHAIGMVTLPSYAAEERERSLSALVEDSAGGVVGSPTVRTPDSFLAPFNGGNIFDALSSPTGAAIASSLVTQHSSLSGNTSFFALNFDGFTEVSGSTDIDAIRSEAAASTLFRVEFTLTEALEFFFIGQLIEIGGGAVAEMEFREIGGPIIASGAGNQFFQFDDTLPAGNYEIRAFASASGSIADDDAFSARAEFNNFTLIFVPEPNSACFLLVGAYAILRRKHRQEWTK